MVSFKYTTVRSNSFSASLRFLPISHMSSSATWSRLGSIKEMNFSMASMRSDAEEEGH